MRNIVLDERPWWASRVILGFDEAGAGGTGGDSGAGDGGAGEGGQGGEDGDGGEQETDADALKNMKVALQKERLRAKNLEKKLAAATKAASGEGSEDDEEQDDTEKGQADTEKGKGAKAKAKAKAPRTDSAAAKQLEKLTAAFRTRSLAETVATLASDFHDPQDVMGKIDQRLLSYTQDDEDPSIVVWDEAEIKAVIKDLRKESPHLVKPKDGSGQQPQRPSGSKFAGGQQQPKKTTAAAKTTEWKNRLPAMRGVPTSNNNSST